MFFSGLRDRRVYPLEVLHGHHRRPRLLRLPLDLRIRRIRTTQTGATKLNKQTNLKTNKTNKQNKQTNKQKYHNKIFYVKRGSCLDRSV